MNNKKDLTISIIGLASSIISACSTAVYVINAVIQRKHDKEMVEETKSLVTTKENEQVCD